ncbi:RHS repeat-associated core domain-containing protein, partial [Cupriavidus numazuensis]
RAWGALKGTKLLHGEEALTGNAIRAQGQYHDEETGLYYNRHRYYDPYSGRFITQDPIGLAGGVNLYQYAPNSTGWVDPLGLTGDDTLKPGPYATESIPARGPERNFTVDERNKINAIGRRDGCHTCGTKDPGKKSGDFILDHQTANALNEDGKPQRLYPHCLLCSRKQAGQVTQAKKRRKGAA